MCGEQSAGPYTVNWVRGSCTHVRGEHLTLPVDTATTTDSPRVRGEDAIADHLVTHPARARGGHDQGKRRRSP
nr:hypothetical protein GCM10020241_26220 [Streptoalloteichus tenebrarius]